MICGDSPYWILYSTITGYFSGPYEQWGGEKKLYLPRSAKY
jgi:hypothetical protein